MKRIVYIIFLMVMPLLSIANDDVNNLFSKGNAQYAKADYQAAIQTYQLVLKGGYQSAAVYFNIGNACYRLRDIPSALLYYEKAHKLAPGDADVNLNIQIANLKTADKMEPAPQFFLSRWWSAFLLGFSLNTLAALSILFIMAGFGVLIFYLFASSVSIKKVSFYAGIALLFFGFVAVLTAAGQSHYFASHRQGIVFGNSINVKTGPGAGSKTMGVVHGGTKVDLMETDNGWLHIKLPNGNDGWVMEGDAKVI